MKTGRPLKDFDIDAESVLLLTASIRELSDVLLVLTQVLRTPPITITHERILPE